MSSEVTQPIQVTASAAPTVAAPPVLNNDLQANQESKDSIMTYVIIGMVVILFLLLAWYAYGKFTDNCNEEAYASGNKQERDDLVADFNLQEAIEEIEKLQRGVLKRLSQSTGI